MGSLSQTLDMVDTIVISNIEEELCGKSIEEKILYYDNKLKPHKITRSKINDLKYSKDSLIKKYMEEIKQPMRLKIKLINYKALFFYFKLNFIESSSVSLKYENYYNLLDSTKNDSLKEKFGSDKSIKIKMLYTNFPHLIGYKNNDSDSASSIYSKGFNDDFLNQIFYEKNLIIDYKEHGCKLDKIDSISWIWETLTNPFYIFDNSGINSSKSKLKGDLIFLKIKGNIVHYVSLIKIGTRENEYVINSQHILIMKKYNDMFIEKNAIYKVDYKLKKSQR